MPWLGAICCSFLWRSVLSFFFGWNPHFGVKKWHSGFIVNWSIHTTCVQESKLLDLTCKVIHFEKQTNLKYRKSKKNTFGYSTFAAFSYARFRQDFLGTRATKLHYSVLRSQASLNIRHDARGNYVWFLPKSTNNLRHIVDHEVRAVSSSVRGDMLSSLYGGILDVIYPEMSWAEPFLLGLSSKPWAMLWKCFILSWLPYLQVNRH